MKTIIVIEVDHAKEIPALGEMIAGRAYTINGVTNAELLKGIAAVPVVTPEHLLAMGFTEREISLGSQDVERG